MCVHGSMFLAIDGDITAVEARFLGRLAGFWILCEAERGGGRRRRDGKRKGGLGMGGGLGGREGRRVGGGDTRPLGRDEGAQGVGGV